MGTQKKEVDYSDLKKYPDRLYTPMEVSNRGWILDRNRNGNYSLVLKLIRVGHLNAENYSVGAKPMYQVKASEIISYLKKYKGITV